MGQGLYRSIGWGCLEPPEYDWDNDESPKLWPAVATSYEAQPYYVMLPFGVDDNCLQSAWNLPPLPDGLPHLRARTAVTVPRCEWCPDVGKTGVWVSSRIVGLWELLRVIAKTRGLELPEGQPIFVCDWD